MGELDLDPSAIERVLGAPAGNEPLVDQPIAQPRDRRWCQVKRMGKIAGLLRTPRRQHDKGPVLRKGDLGRYLGE